MHMIELKSFDSSLRCLIKIDCKIEVKSAMETIYYSYHMQIVLSLVALVSVSGAGEKCPPWFLLRRNNDSQFPQCVCSEAMPTKIVCSQIEQMSFLKLGHCAYQDETISATVVSDCPYMFPAHLIHDGLIRLPHNTSQLNSFVCGHLKREITAPLCGRCANGTGPSIYSFGSQCATCRSVNRLYYLLFQYVPTTVIFLVILLFRIDVVSPPMGHYILYCNLLVLGFRSNIGLPILLVSMSAYSSALIRLVVTLNAIWTFDTLYFLSPPLCISESIQLIHVPIFNALAASYPFILLLLTYIAIELYARDFKLVVVVWKPFYRIFGKYLKSWNGDKSLIQTLAALFYLSFTKYLNVVLESFLWADITTQEGDVVATTSYIDPTVIFFSQKQVPLIVTSVVIVIFIISPPILLLILYPTTCFRKCSTCLKPRWMLTLQIFADTFQGCYKNGTNGTRDYRQMAGYMLSPWIVCPVLVFVGQLITSNDTQVSLGITILVSMLLGVAILMLEPYQHRTANISGTLVSFFIMLGLILGKDFQWYSSAELAMVCIAIFTVPHCVFCGCVMYRMIKRVRHCATTVRREEGILHRLVRNRDNQ